MDATNNYTCGMVTIYKLLVLCSQNIFTSPVITIAKSDFGTNDVTSMIETTLSTISSPSRVF